MTKKISRPKRKNAQESDPKGVMVVGPNQLAASPTIHHIFINDA